MNARSYFSLCMVLFFVKAVLLIFLAFHDYNFFGGGNDADYYHAYALGLDDTVANVWPIILRFLNEIGLYSRPGVGGILLFLGIVLVPYMVAKLSIVKESSARNKFFWGVVLLVSAYPTLFYYTFDIYRDVFMVFVFLVGVFFLRKISITRTGFYKFLLFLVAFAIAYFLFLLRPYLGLAFGVSLVFSGFYSFKRYPLLLSFLGLCAGLNTLYFFGFLDLILKYRSMFSNGLEGGSNFGIVFSSAASFLPDLFKSVSYQLFGFFFVNLPSMVVFLLESVPFIFALSYLVVNRKYSSKFVDYIVVFFVAYSVVWLLGNDNLGTAVRLRVFNYLAIYIACMIVYQNKIIFFSDRSNI